MRRDYTCPSDSSTWEDAEATFGTVAKKVLLPIRQGEPQAFIARQAPASSIPPHFHPINQFLIIVEGGGSLGPKPLKPVTVHYTDGNTAYGPIDAGPDGLAFFNCRQISTTEAYFMPESRDRLPRPQGREIVAYDQDIPYQSVRRSDSGETVEHKLLMGSEDGGPWAELYRYGPGQTLGLSPRNRELGQFHIVIDGELTVGEEFLGPWSVRYLEGSGDVKSAIVGNAGATVLVLTFDQRREPNT